MRPRLHHFLSLTLMTVLLSLQSPADNNPVANKRAVVNGTHVRFTILTSQLIRMEWSPNDTFEDHASLVFINRNLPVPEFTTRNDQGWLVISTSDLEVRYANRGNQFSDSNLSVTIKSMNPQVTWKPGTPDTANLGGTIRTLDGVQGATKLEPGLLSRDGWVVVDDSRRPLFDNSDWPWVLPRDTNDHQDLYFFGYGHNYKKVLYDFTQVAGKIPMPPRFAFGLWWSRYWAYTDEEFKELVHEFEEYDVPLDVLVIDMDWHQTFDLRWGSGKKDQAGERLGWTGYTWDTTFFPNPPAFLKWCDSKGLRTPLNLHPASGIQPHEDHYPEMAKAMGIDPATKKYVPFDITDKKFATNYLNLIIRPLEKEGVDFWWLDWQQWSKTNIPGVTPTWWLNYVFFTDMERRNTVRPLLFHRWGGLGNHRYQIGFSGDAISVWPSLAFQPYFTATAANVGYGYWSHDIGGHMPGPVSAELYTRWIQFGAFSPIVRTHTTKNPKAERRIWAYPVENFKAMRDMILLRYAMIPYIYTEARKTFDTGVSMCRPMYYDYPDRDEAYTFKDQYMFGDQLLVAPIAEPVDSVSMLASKDVWLPAGEWIEWFSGKRMSGPTVVRRLFPFDEMPVYAKAGSIIPMQPKMKNSHEKPVDLLILTVFPGDSGTFMLYEDEGNSSGYRIDECARTRTEQSFRGDVQEVTIKPSQGKFPGMLQHRAYVLRIPGTLPPSRVLCNGKMIPFAAVDSRAGWWYDGEHCMTMISAPSFSVREEVRITIAYADDRKTMDLVVDEIPGIIARLRTAMNTINGAWPEDWSPDILVHAVQTGNRVSLNPQHARDEYTALRKRLADIHSQISQLQIDAPVKARADAHLRGISE